MRLLTMILALSLAVPAAAQQVSSLDKPASQVTVDSLMMNQAQSIEATVDSSGDYTWTFPAAYAAPPRVAYFPKNSDKTLPIVCNYQSLTATAVTFHCYKASSILNLTLPVNIFSTAAANATVTVVARGTLAALPPP